MFGGKSLLYVVHWSPCDALLQLHCRTTADRCPVCGHKLLVQAHQKYFEQRACHLHLHLELLLYSLPLLSGDVWSS